MNDPDIAWFEPDFGIVMPGPSTSGSSSGQQIPWGVAAIDGMESWTISGNGSGSVDVLVYILDTGVANADSGDPYDDLALVESRDFRDLTMPNAGDIDGPGTHIAGIVGAIDDQDNFVGIAPSARIHKYP